MTANHVDTSSLTRRLIHEIEGGLPLVSKPYAEIAGRLSIEESRVISLIKSLKQSGAIKRIGVVVRHRELGYHSNAMVVWNVPDAEVDPIGQLFGQASFVTLCYRRPRRLPDWPYNLFTMIHGRDRQHVLGLIEKLKGEVAGPPYPNAVLFSTRRFKQRGARYGGAAINFPFVPKEHLHQS